MKRANVHSKHYNLDYKNYIIIENLDDLHAYYEESLNGRIKETATRLVERAKDEIKEGYKKEISEDPIENYAEHLAKSKGFGVVYAECVAIGNLQANWCMSILDGKILVIRPSNGVSWFTLCEGDTYEIISTKERYTLDDIRVMRFPDGVHWYAKIGRIDVVIDGEQKWDLKFVAQQKAEQYLKEKLNQ